MKTKKLGLLSLLFVLALGSAFAQEVCNNGIDDDGDGFIDCFDSDCASNSTCDGTYLGNDVICQAKPTTFPQFTMKLKWQSANQTTTHLNRASVGDLDRDGIPEVVVTQFTYDGSGFQNGGAINILSGSTGAVKASIPVTYTINRDPLIANIKNDNCAWIFVHDQNGTVYAYTSCDQKQQWKASVSSANSATLLGIADFDGDGKSEIYARDAIIAAESGVVIVNPSISNAAGGPVAVDILDASGNVAGAGDNKLELILGCNIYGVNLGARTAGSGSLTLKKNAANYKFWEKNGNTSLTSVADYNQDGKLDVIATGTLDVTTTTGGSKPKTVTNSYATAFYWDVQNNVVKTFYDATTTSFFIAGCSNKNATAYQYGWQNGLGRINIADIDGDGKLNATYISGKHPHTRVD